MSPCRWLALAVLLVLLGGCSGARPGDLGVHDGRLAPCASSPNCVSSDATGDGDVHAVEPLRLTGDASRAWEAARDAVAALPRTRIVSETPHYLHAECRSAVFGFLDDLELNLRPGAAIIAVRSASRLGYSDFGVNQRRIETLRAELARRGLIRPASSPGHP